MPKFYDCGIDLGTTNSCIARATNESVVIIDNVTDRMSVTPSAVYINERGKKQIGQRAYTQTNVDNVSREFKRLMGKVDIKVFKGTGIKMTPEELSAEVLMTLRSDASQTTGEELNDVILTVPAGFGTLQCEATNNAAKLAGFNNVILLQEPIAAAIAYGAKPNAKDQYWMVFDFGGGTLDVAIISTYDNHLTVINTEGDNYLGGSDIDNLLFEKVILPKIKANYSFNNGLDKEWVRKIILMIEEAKIRLSTAESATVEIYDMGDDDNGDYVDIKIEINRKDFENIIASLVFKCVSIAEAALEGSKIKKEKINKILLVGGSTFIPLVRQKLKEKFQIELDSSVNPMTAVAVGAAIYASTSIVENEMKVIKNNDSSKANINLQYENLTSDEYANIVGVIENAKKFGIIEVKIDNISNDEDNASGAWWTSGWVDLPDKGTGIFDINVKLRKNRGNNFKIYTRDFNKSSVPTSDDIFIIKHSEHALTAAAPPITKSICIAVEDESYGELDVVIKKNTPLPAEGQRIYKTNKILNPNTDDKIAIEIWEGEETKNIQANTWVGNVYIQSTVLRRPLPVGTEVELKVNIDTSRRITVTGYIPDIDYVIPEEILFAIDNEDVDKRINEIEEKLEEIELSFQTFKKSNIDVSGLQNEFEEIKETYEEAYELVNEDNVKVQLYINKFYEFQIKVIELERKHSNIHNTLHDSEKIQDIEEQIERYGGEFEKDEFNNIRDMYEKTLEGDKDGRKHYLEKMEKHKMNTWLGSVDFLSRYFTAYLSPEYIRYKNDAQASYWKSHAYSAMGERDIDNLNEAVFALLDLKVQSANQQTTKITLDLRR